VARGGTHWNAARVAETYSIGMVYDALAPTIAACSYVDGTERFPNASAPALRLQRALDSHAVIDQAIGIIRSRSCSTADEAFQRLTRISQTENIKLHAVAQRLVEEAVRRARARHR
jgi:hypothetical protein